MTLSAPESYTVKDVVKNINKNHLKIRGKKERKKDVCSFIQPLALTLRKYCDCISGYLV